MSHSSTDDPRLVPLGVMAADLGVSPSDLRREALAGRVPCVKVGNRGLLFDRELVHRALLERLCQRREERDGRTA
jgi:hypothetical protein